MTSLSPISREALRHYSSTIQFYRSARFGRFVFAILKTDSPLLCRGSFLLTDIAAINEGGISHAPSQPLARPHRLSTHCWDKKQTKEDLFDYKLISDSGFRGLKVAAQAIS